MDMIKIAAMFDELEKIAALSGQKMKSINDFLARVSGAAGKSAVKSKPKTLVIGKGGVQRIPHPGAIGKVKPPPIPAGA